MAEQYDDLYASIVLDINGSRIGGVSQVYLDDATGEPTFVVARTGLFGNKEVCVPLIGASFVDGFIQVPHFADLIKTAPQPSPDRKLDRQREAELYQHYGLPFKLPQPAGEKSSAVAPAVTAPVPDAAPSAGVESAAQTANPGVTGETGQSSPDAGQVPPPEHAGQ